MIRICYSKYHVGDRKFGEKPPLEDKRETHGICEGCLVLEKEDIEKALMRGSVEEGKIYRINT